MSLLNKPSGKPIFCYVTDRRLFPTQDPAGMRELLLRRIEAAAAAGVDWIQLREKDLSGRDCTVLTREGLRRVAKVSGAGKNPTRILVNERLDVALSERAAGVHLGESSLPVAEAQRLAASYSHNDEFLVGASCHSLEAAQSAESGGANYIFFGPVFATPSKAAYGAPQGLERLAGVCRAVSIPVLGIGGVTLENAASCFAAGAKGIAAIRLFQDAQDMVCVVQSLKNLI